LLLRELVDAGDQVQGLGFEIADRGFAVLQVVIAERFRLAALARTAELVIR
jgi:hypothetical protein